MMTGKNYFALAAFLLGCLGIAGAQTLHEGLFLDGNQTGYRANPALVKGNGFLCIRSYATDQLTNIGASAFLYPQEGRVVTALHSSVPAETFLNNLKAENSLVRNMTYNLFSYGNARGKAFHTFEINLRGMYGASVPKSIFELVKTGIKTSTYSLGNTHVEGNAYAEFAYGHTRKLSDKVTVGARAKLLAGLVSADYRLTRMDMTLNENAYTADVESEMRVTNSLLSFPKDEDGNYVFRKPTTKGSRKLPGGYGAAFDLGIVVTPVKGLVLSAAVLDLGGILWHYGNAGYSQGTASFQGFGDVSFDQLNGADLLELIRDAGNDFLGTLKLKPANRINRFEALPIRINGGVRYAMPFHERLTAGVTGQYTGFQNMPYWAGRFCLSERPLDWLDIMGNVGADSHGGVWGIAGTLRIAQCRINMSMDRSFGRYLPGHRSIPLKACYKVFSVGITYEL